jgi:hypothetical protein
VFSIGDDHVKLGPLRAITLKSNIPAVATAAVLQVTGIGTSGRVTLRSFSDSCRVIFFGPTVVSRGGMMRTPRVQKWRPRAYQRLGDVERAPSVSRDHFCVVGIAGVIARLSCKRLRPICPTCGRCSDKLNSVHSTSVRHSASGFLCAQSSEGCYQSRCHGDGRVAPTRCCGNRHPFLLFHPLACLLRLLCFLGHTRSPDLHKDYSVLAAHLLSSASSAALE